jgi:ABC-type dipeptide/oligopeptide/nickel transport system permease component
MTMPATLFLLMLATVLVLVSGIVLMAIGGKANTKYGNKLMVARVVLQAASIILLAILYFAYHSSQ